MRRSVWLLALGCLAISFQAAARMYQWLDSASGNVRLSGEPPPWYRSGQQGPRTLVFENGQIIDDTAILIPQERREKLRESAFEEVDLRREREAVKKLERAALRESRRRQEARAAELEQVKSQAGQAAQPAEAAGKSADAATPEALDDAMVERLKSIISEWDQQQASDSGKP